MQEKQLYPGFEVRVIEGRHKGKEGIILSSEQVAGRLHIYEVRVILDRNKYIKSKSGQYVYAGKYTLISKFARGSLELLTPIETTENEIKSGRLLMVERRIKNAGHSKG
jgi:ribosomal protein L24